jgi:uncharacterized protein (TIGR02246 family)
MPDDKQLIRDLIETWMRESEAGNLDQVLRLMDDDVVFLLPGQPPMRGKEEFAKNFPPPGKVKIDGKSDIQEIEILGDYAYCWNKLSVTVTPPDGKSMRRSGNILSIFRKKSDGFWVLYRDANMLTMEPTPDK